MNKVIRDGKVAVLVSPGFGAGWSTWNPTVPEMLFDPAIVQMVEDNTDPATIAMVAEAKYTNCYSSGVSDLMIVWVPIGTEFKVDEYDGAESIIFKEQEKWITA